MGDFAKPEYLGALAIVLAGLGIVWRQWRKDCADHAKALATEREERIEELRALVPLIERAAKGDEQSAAALAEVLAVLARWEKLLPDVANFSRAMAP